MLYRTFTVTRGGVGIATMCSAPCTIEEAQQYVAGIWHDADVTPRGEPIKTDEGAGV